MKEIVSSLNGTGALFLSELTPELAAGAAGGTVLRASGWSMYPAIGKGDRVALSPPENLAAGDVIVFRQDGRLLCHRIQEIAPAGMLVTKGDHAQIADSPISASQVVGRVIEVVGSRRLLPARLAIRFDRLGRGLRARLLASLGALARLPGPRLAVSALLPRCCAYFAASRAPVQLIEAYSFLQLRGGAPAGPHDFLLARLLGRTVARLSSETGVMEIHEALAGLGIEERLRSWARPR